MLAVKAPELLDAPLPFGLILLDLCQGHLSLEPMACGLDGGSFLFSNHGINQLAHIWIGEG